MQVQTIFLGEDTCKSLSAAGMAFQIFCWVTPCCHAQILCYCLLLFHFHMYNVWVQALQVDRWLFRNMESHLTMRGTDALPGLDQNSHTSSTQNHVQMDGCDKLLLFSSDCNKEEEGQSKGQARNTHMAKLI